jgi:anti-sigma factor ChrR (cupin superfamily)
MRDQLEALDRRLAFLRTELAVAERKAAEWKLREADEQLAQAKAQAQATSGTHQA